MAGDLEALMNEVVAGEKVPVAPASRPLAPSTRQPPAPYQTVPRHPSGACAGIGKVSYTHDGMIDLIIANPEISQGQIAQHFGYKSASWISQIISSDAFQIRLAERSEQLIDKGVLLSIREKFDGLIQRSLEILNYKLDKHPNDVPDNLAVQVLQTASKARGYGAREQAIATTVNVDVHLEKLGDNLTDLLRRRKAVAQASPIIEGDFHAQAG